MKATKLLCGIAAMALAFAACNKVDQPANESDNLKSIAVDFGNILSTKSVDTPAPSDPSVKITVNDLQVFFTDGSKFYQAKDATGANAVQYFSTSAVSSASQVYHFLPAAVKDVIVVANLGKPKTFANVAALEAEIVDASTQQRNSNVALYGRATATPATQPEANNHNADYYEATVNLSTRVARIEVEGFEYAADADANRVYQSIVVDKIAVANYGLTCPLVTGAVATSATADISTPTKINNYFESLKSLTTNWMVDAPEAATLDADHLYKWTVPSGMEDDEAIVQTYAYTVIPTAVPNICVALRGKVDAAADDETATPLFLATKALRLNETELLPALEAGRVYRLNFKFDDKALNTQGKCIDVTVTVDSWVIVPVTPEF